MEPITLIAIFAAAFVVKLGEKAADVLGERAAENGGNLLSVLQHKDPDAVRAIERIARRSDLSEENFVDAEVIELASRVARSANTDPDVKQAIDATDTAMGQDPRAIVIKSKLAEKIGAVNFGTIGTQNITNNY